METALRLGRKRRAETGGRLGTPACQSSRRSSPSVRAQELRQSSAHGTLSPQASNCPRALGHLRTFLSQLDYLEEKPRNRCTLMSTPCPITSPLLLPLISSL